MTPDNIRRVLRLNYDATGPRTYITAKVPLALVPPVEGNVRAWFDHIGHAEWEKDEPTWKVLAHLSAAHAWAKALGAFVHDAHLYLTYCLKPHQTLSMNEFVKELAAACREAVLCNTAIEVPDKPLHREDFGIPEEVEPVSE